MDLAADPLVVREDDEVPTHAMRVVCLSHLPSDGVWQRPQQVLSRLACHAAWFYTPTPVDVLDFIPFDIVVYDVMDELSGFRGATVDLPARESRLLTAADVVFAGGRSLYESRRARHDDVHLCPSGVEARHSTQAADIAREVANLPRPVLGYVGVIDERLDLTLLDGVTAARPDGRSSSSGRWPRSRPDSVPRRPNIVHLGAQPYDRLPSLVAVPDVVSERGSVVEIAEGSAAFVDAVTGVLDEPQERRDGRLSRQRRFVSAGEWDARVERMWEGVIGGAGHRAGRRLAHRKEPQWHSSWSSSFSP